MNLERTGPLSTSSPSSRAEGAPDSRDCRSPALLGTTPIRGSYTGRRKSQEKSSGAGSPGSHGQSFLNSALWDDWNEEDQRSSEAPPLPQTPRTDGPQRSHKLQTPREYWEGVCLCFNTKGHNDSEGRPALPLPA